MFNIQTAKYIEDRFCQHYVDDIVVPEIKTAILIRKAYVVQSVPSAYGLETCARNGCLGRVIVELEVRGFTVVAFRRSRDGGIRLLISGWSDKDFHEKGHLDELWERIDHPELLGTEHLKMEF